MALTMLKIHHQYFSDRTEAVAEIQDNQLHVMEFDVPSVDNSVHWHRFDATLYLLEGTLSLTEGATGEVHRVTVGDKVMLPEGTLHAERSEGYTVLLGSSIPAEQFDNPVDLPPEALP